MGHLFYTSIRTWLFYWFVDFDGSAVPTYLPNCTPYALHKVSQIFLKSYLRFLQFSRAVIYMYICYFKIVCIVVEFLWSGDYSAYTISPKFHLMKISLSYVSATFSHLYLCVVIFSSPCELTVSILEYALILLLFIHVGLANFIISLSLLLLFISLFVFCFYSQRKS